MGRKAQLLQVHNKKTLSRGDYSVVIILYRKKWEGSCLPQTCSFNFFFQCPAFGHNILFGKDWHFIQLLSELVIVLWQRISPRTDLTIINKNIRWRLMFPLFENFKNLTRTLFHRLSKTTCIWSHRLWLPWKIRLPKQPMTV